MDNDRPLVTAVIPLYNKARHIQRSINSVLNQTFKNTEVIVIDDGSTDGGADVAREIKDPRLKVISKPNQGVSSARNKGIELASGELIAFLDADDEWRLTFLQTLIDLRERFPQAGMYATAYSVYQGEKVWGPENLSYLPKDPKGVLLKDYFLAGCESGPIISSNVMVPKKILEEVGCFPTELIRTEDLVTWMKVAMRYPVAWSPQDLAIWHEDADNRTIHSYLNVMGEPIFTEILDDFLKSGQQPVYPVESIREYIAKYNLFFVMYNWLGGDTRTARKLLAECCGTKVFHKKWMALNILTAAPRPVSMAVWKLNEIFHGRSPVVGKCGNIRIPNPEPQTVSAANGGG